MLHVISIPLIILATLAVGFILVYLIDILVPFIVAIFFVYLLKPVIDFLTKPFSCGCLADMCEYRPNARQVHNRWYKRAKRDPEEADLDKLMVSMDKVNVGRDNAVPFTVTHPCRNECRCPYWLAVVVSLCFASTLFSGLVLLVLGSIQSFQENDLQQYKAQAVVVTNYTVSWLNSALGVEADRLVLHMIQDIPVADYAKGMLYTMLNMVMNTFFVLLVVFYLVFEKTVQQEGSLRHQIDQEIQKYIGLKTLVSAVAALLVGFLFYMLSIRLCYLLAVLTFLLNYIPNVGPIVATMLPLPVVVFDPDLGVGAMFFAFMLPSIIHFIVGNFVEPAVFGRSMELHPLVVLLSLALWYSLWGVPGAILAVPLAAVFRIVVSNINHPYASKIQHLMQGTASHADRNPGVFNV